MLIEIKDGSKIPSAQKLTPAELTSALEFAAHGVQVHVVNSVEKAMAL